MLVSASSSGFNRKLNDQEATFKDFFGALVAFYIVFGKVSPQRTATQSDLFHWPTEWLGWQERKG